MMTRFSASRLLTFAARLVVVVIVLAIATPGKAQGTTAGPSFEVATIKLTDPNVKSMTGTGPSWPNKFVSMNEPLTQAIKYAYAISSQSDNQIVGGPAWISSQNFDIQAKLDVNLTKLSTQGAANLLRPMVQNLLADRCKLQIHHGNLVLPACVLTVTKNGSKLKPSVVVADIEDGNQSAQPHGLFLRGKGRLEGAQATPDMLATILGMQPAIGVRPLIDKTGLTGKYDFTLIWTPEDSVGATSGEGGLFTALQEQLGLKLESTKAPVDVIVIDHIEMPSAN